MEDCVCKDVCEARHKAVDERNARDVKDIETLDNRTSQIEKLTIRMGQIIETHDAKITEHDKRIVALEEKPIKRWEAVVGQLISLFVAALVGALFAKFF